MKNTDFYRTCMHGLPLSAREQDNTQQDTLRSFCVKVVDRKGKPIPNPVVSSAGQTSFLTDRNGMVSPMGSAMVILLWYSCPT